MWRGAISFLKPKTNQRKRLKWIPNCQGFHNLLGEALSTALQVIDPFKSTYQTSWRPSKKISANAIFAGLFKKKHLEMNPKTGLDFDNLIVPIPITLGTFQSLHVLYHLQWGFITLGSKQTRRVPLDQSKWAECQMCIWKKPRGENESKSNLQLSEYIHPRKLLEGGFPFQRVDVWGAFRFSGVDTSQVSMQQNSVSWDKDQEPSTPPVRHQNCARCTDVIVRLLRQAIQLL